jgi:uncharacterized protein YjbI with pentapeptide repeats
VKPLENESYHSKPMANKLAKVPNWYTKKPKDFQEEIWDWLTDGSRGGELGQLFVNFLRRRQFHRHLVKTLKSRAFRGVAVVLAITLMGYLIQRDEETPWQKTIFENLESIALGSAGIIFLLESRDRQKRDHYEAWQVVNSARGNAGSGGRIQALQDLNKDGVNLEGIAVRKAYLSGIELSGASLVGGDFKEARLYKANLQGADLRFANLQGADLRSANLQGALLSAANLKEANLDSANLKKAVLFGTELQGARLAHATLENADLEGAQLQRTCWVGTYTRNTNLSGANLEGAEKIRQEQLAQSLLCRTVLPSNMTCTRDCKKLARNPNTGLPIINSEIVNMQFKPHKT